MEKGHATVKSNESGTPIDGIWGMHGVQITAGGYHPYWEFLKSDHHFLWVKICLKHTFDTTFPPLWKPIARSLQMDDPHSQRRYLRTLHKWAQKYDLLKCYTEVASTATFPSDTDTNREYKCLDLLRSKE
eukprot:3609634-Ditylum_brightwellii.AAC.1